MQSQSRFATDGLFKGKEGIKRFFWGFLEKRRESSQAGRMAIHMQHQGVIDIAPDGKTGMGRWYLVMIQARPLEAGGPNKSVLGHGVYENEFVKEDGTWKFKKMFMSLTYRSPMAKAGHVYQTWTRGRLQELMRHPPMAIGTRIRALFRFTGNTLSPVSEPRKKV